MPYQSVGGAATGALLDALAERERSKQQALQNQRVLMQDQLARDKEAREAQYQRDEITNRQQELAQRKAEATANEERAWNNDYVKSVKENHLPGDVFTDATSAAKVLRLAPDLVQVKRDTAAVGPVPEGQMPVGTAVTYAGDALQRTVAQAKADVAAQKAKDDAAVADLTARVGQGIPKELGPRTALAMEAERLHVPIPASSLEPQTKDIPVYGPGGNQIRTDTVGANAAPLHLSYPPQAATGEESPAMRERSRLDARKQIDVMEKPALEQLKNFQELEKQARQTTNLSDATVLPSLIKAVVGGVGSGVRITQGEINNAKVAQNRWDALKAAASQWSLNPQASIQIEPQMREDILKLSAALRAKLTDRVHSLSSAKDELVTSADSESHRQILRKAEKAFEDDLTTPANIAQSSGPKSVRLASGKTVTVGDTVKLKNGTSVVVKDIANGQIVY